MELTDKKTGSDENAEKTNTLIGEYFHAIVLVLAIAGFGALLAFGKLTRGTETRHVFDAMVQTRGCVVADIKNRTPSSYRCDKPVVGRYVEASAMWDEAEAVVDARYAKK